MDNYQYSVKFRNNATGTLAGNIDNLATTIQLATGQGARFPALSAGEWFVATLMDDVGNVEIIKVTARSSDTLTVERNQEGTVARAFDGGSIIELRVTAGPLQQMRDDLDSHKQTLDALGTAATKNVGQSAAQLPRNQDLGSASKKDHGTGDAELPTKAQVDSLIANAIDSAKAQFLAKDVGLVVYRSGTGPAGDEVEADGSLLSRASYPELWAYVQASGNLASTDAGRDNGQYSPGNGSSTFRVPDLRGQFIRAADASHGVGEFEADQNKSHSHGGSVSSGGAHSHSASSASAGSHGHSASTSNAGHHSHDGSVSWQAAHSHSGTTTTNGGHSHNVGTVRFSGSNDALMTDSTSNPQNLATSPSGAHSHNLNINNGGAHNHTLSIDGTGAHNHPVSVNSNGAHSHDVTVNNGGSHSHGLSINNDGGSEARPANWRMLICIKTGRLT